MLPIQVFATGIKLLITKNCLIVSFWGSWALDFQRVEGQIAAVCSWSIDFSNSWSLDRPPKGPLIAWFNFDPSRKHFYTEHTPYKTKVPVRQDSSCFCGLLWQSVASFPDSQCILTWFIASLLVDPGNELHCKPNLGRVVMYTSLAVWCFQSRNCKQNINSWIETRTSVLASGLFVCKAIWHTHCKQTYK